MLLMLSSPLYYINLKSDCPPFFPLFFLSFLSNQTCNKHNFCSPVRSKHHSCTLKESVENQNIYNKLNLSFQPLRRHCMILTLSSPLYHKNSKSDYPSFFRLSFFFFFSFSFSFSFSFAFSETKHAITSQLHYLKEAVENQKNKSKFSIIKEQLHAFNALLPFILQKFNKESKAHNN